MSINRGLGQSRNPRDPSIVTSHYHSVTRQAVVEKMSEIDIFFFRQNALVQTILLNLKICMMMFVMS